MSLRIAVLLAPHAGVAVILSAAVARVQEVGALPRDAVVAASDVVGTLRSVTNPADGRSAGCDLFDFERDPHIHAIEDAGVLAPLTPTQVIEIETVFVGNAGNPGDAQFDGTFGGVSYDYNMAKYEVTAGQYAVFLNAVGAADPYGLYSAQMWAHAHGCRIRRTGSPGSYAYRLAPAWANRPVNFVSFGDALRFANWLHNGQPSGEQALHTTEDGSYFLNGQVADWQLEDVYRELDATWVVPSEDEWYKAAYHANDGPTGNYFSYPMSNDFGISNDLTTPDPGRHATYFNHPGDYTIGAPYYRTEVGAHENSASPYGTFDQGGNIVEWNEAIPLFDGRGLRGGAYLWGSDLLGAWSRPIEYHSSDEFSDIGFRVGRLN